MATHLNNRRGMSRIISNHTDAGSATSSRRRDGPLELESSSNSNNNSDHRDHDHDRPHVPPVAITSVPWALEAATSSPPHSAQEERSTTVKIDMVSESAMSRDAGMKEEQICSGEDVGPDDDMIGLLAEELSPSKRAAISEGNIGGTPLAGSDHTSVERQSTPSTFCKCLPCEKVGHCTVFLPKVYRRTNRWLGIVGPHWYGSLCTLGLLWGTGGNFTYKAFGQALYQLHELHDQQESTEDPLGWKDLALVWFKPTLCLFFLFYSTIYLALTCCANPGIVTEANNGYAQHQESLTQEAVDASETGNGGRRRRRPPFRWCDICR
jgi:hypothetical protein